MNAQDIARLLLVVFAAIGMLAICGWVDKKITKWERYYQRKLYERQTNSSNV